MLAPIWARLPKLNAAIVAILALAIFAPLQAGAQVKGDQWTFTVTPYLWLPNVDGTLKYNIPPGSNGRPEVRVGPNDYLENLEFVMMVSGEVRKKEWALFTDFVYLDFQSQKSSVTAVDFSLTTRNPISSSINVDTQSTLRGGLWTLAGSYAALQGGIVNLEVLGGFRYFTIKASSDWRLTATINGPGGGQVFPASGSISQSADLWDGIVGVRGQIRLGRSNWVVPYYLDAGTGSSSFTWQGMAGIAYQFTWGGVHLLYRHLYYDQKDDKLVQNMRFSGPTMGVMFRF